MLGNIFERFEEITRYDIEEYLNEFSDFVSEDYQSIAKFFSGESDSIDGNIVVRLDDLTKEANNISLLFNNFKDSLSTLTDYWDLLIIFEDSKTKLQTITNSDIWFRSIKKFNYDNKFTKEFILKEGQTLQNLAAQVGYNNPVDDWVDVALDNTLSEDEYTSEGGTKLKVTFENNLRVNIETVVDSVDGINVYGKDIQRKIEYQKLGEEFNVMNFNGTDTYVSLGSIPDVSGVKTIRFKAYFTTTGFQDVLAIVSDYTDHIGVNLFNDSFKIYTGETDTGGLIDLTTIPGGYTNKVLDVVITKGTSTLTSVTINGLNMTINPVTGDWSGITDYGAWFGAHPANGAGTGIEQGSVWDIYLDGIGNWNGKGNDADENSAWEDQIGTNNGTVNGTATLRNIDTTYYEDLVVLNYKDTLNQSFKILIDTVQGSVPEFPRDGIDKGLIASNVNSIQYPVLFRQLSNLFAKDDTFKNFQVTGINREDDATYLDLQTETRLNDVLNQSKILSQ
jgi:hypothetical protein